MPKTQFGVVLMGGQTLVRCTVLGEANEGAPVPVPMEGLGGGQMLSITFYSPTIVEKAGLSWEGTLVMNGERFTLGTISTRKENVSIEVPYPTQPVVAALHIVVHGAPACHNVSELAESLAVCAVAILEDPDLNPRHGSLQLAQVIDEVLVREYETFGAVEEKAPGTLEAMLVADMSRFTIFSYSEKEVVDRQMGDATEAGKPRIVLKQRSALQFTRDDEEDLLVAYLVRVLAERDYSCDELLMRMHEDNKSDCLAYPVCPGFSFLMRFLRRNTDLFSWTADPNQVTMISLRPEDMPPPAGNAEKKTRRKRHSARNGTEGGRAADATAKTPGATAIATPTKGPCGAVDFDGDATAGGLAPMQEVPPTPTEVTSAA